MRWAMVLVLSGCSFLKTHAPAPPPGDPNCITGPAPPIVDLAIAGVSLIGAIVSHGGGSLGSEEVVPEFGFAVAGVAAVGSAVYGFVRTAQCRKAYENR